ncbi:thioredoxin family protein [Poseidonibacter lekithochrous]|uniref:thioredoxin family protein n=1 Tax=Poseidonibacter lekithochrous TaxID=1904463 RepID=UPI0009F89D99|nr:thioredoxin family protein [Poseidonibacter lekithochrous]QKJ24439.1 thioredoxin [Poseidonibacter lekithochrous]
MKKIVFILLLSVASAFAFEELNMDNFESKIKGKNVIIDFYAVWCPPCKVLNNKLEEYDIVKPDNVTIYKINIDDQPLITKKFGITRLPSLVYFQDGKAVKTKIGIQSVDELESNANSIFN